MAGSHRIDLTDDPYQEQQYRRLVDALHGKLPEEPPPLGARPRGVGGRSSVSSPSDTDKGKPKQLVGGVAVHRDGVPLEGVDVLALFPNKTWKHGTTDAFGEARVELHSVNVPLTVFVGAAGYAGHVERDWIPAERTLTIELSDLPGGGSVVFENGTGYIPGLAGRLNPILDTTNRTYLYARNIAISGGRQQPVSFVPGKEELHLTDANGIAMLVRVVAIAGRASLLEYGPVRNNVGSI